RLVTVSSPSCDLSQGREGKGKIPGEPDGGLRNARTGPSEGPGGGDEGYQTAEGADTAKAVPVAVGHNGGKTFEKIAKQTALSSNSFSAPTSNNVWQSYGPIQNSVQPGVLSFSGATTPTASRDTALVVAPTCVPGNCRLWVGTAGGGVWRTNDALAADPLWSWLTPDAAQN